jgi:FKBP-type peptidyl-prolyl cis-trans isomerase
MIRKYSPLAFALLLLVAVAGCFNNSRFQGFSETNSGLFYKLHSFGESARKPQEGNYLVLQMAYRTEKDSLFIDTYSSSRDGRITVPFTQAPFKGGLEEGIAMLNEGDSATFIVSADSLFRKVLRVPLPYFIEPGGVVKVDVKLERILAAEEYKKIQEEELAKAEDLDIEEYKMLKKFMTDNYPGKDAKSNGLYFIEEKPGAGPAAGSGKTVVVSYKGAFLNGRQFDVTAAPLEFTIGQQGQVIKGLECGICLMKEGGKAKFILPSQLAFGASGSSTGIVPPFTPVIYEVELLKVKQ